MPISVKPWWIKRGPSSLQAFAYPGNPLFPEKFAKSYGGEAAEEFDIPTEFCSLGDSGSEILSVLERSSDRVSHESVLTDPLRYKLYVWVGEEWTCFDAGYKTLKEANSVAKTLFRIFGRVAVVRKRYVEG